MLHPYLGEVCIWTVGTKRPSVELERPEDHVNLSVPRSVVGTIAGWPPMSSVLLGAE